MKLKKEKAFKKDEKLVKTKNIIKLEKQIKLIDRKLSNIRINYIHQTTSAIVKTKPLRVVMENLNIKGMMKNKHLAKSVQEQFFYEFKRQMKYKCECGLEINRDKNASINLLRYKLAE